MIGLRSKKINVVYCEEADTQEGGRYPLSSLQAHTVAVNCIAIVSNKYAIEHGEIKSIH